MLPNEYTIMNNKLVIGKYWNHFPVLWSARMLHPFNETIHRIVRQLGKDCEVYLFLPPPSSSIFSVARKMYMFLAYRRRMLWSVHLILFLCHGNKEVSQCISHNESNTWLILSEEHQINLLYRPHLHTENCSKYGSMIRNGTQCTDFLFHFYKLGKEKWSFMKNKTKKKRYKKLEITIWWSI